ncbi:Conidial pigment biosynthesis cluster H [Hyphodiscus hymeniophilus]|uniref:Conidial pigment biosynthesis cluster H n=1 Tax=Hyphodiscus hymeniophilus TaxID=353542 RepID=A0A9P7AX40_9HELO|nr:Conidial pigment biosynthesis cluster H [Hyphodiscus hymeniophilus]
MVFCAYCGQNFKRKEHLERHLPTHTNVKPYRCDSCQLSFARKDLLQKHHSTYHEVHDSTNRSDGERVKPQRTPIACTKCASAKAACDKKVPCSRCVDKNLPCDARFARRSAKVMTVRNTSPTEKATVEYQNIKETSQPQEAEVIAEIHICDEDQFLQDQTNQDIMTWETSQKMLEYPLHDLRYSSESIDTIPSSETGREGVDGFLRSKGSVGVDLHIVDFEEIHQMWGNYSMDSGMEFSHQPVIPYLPFPPMNGDRSHIHSMSLTSPSLSTATSHSHLNGISSWKGSLEPRIQEPSLSMTWHDSGNIPELEIVIAADEAWPLARCNLPIFSGACPRTALVHLQNFQDSSKLEDSWNSMNDLLCPTAEHNLEQTPIAIIPLFTTTRDKIIAIAQSFLQKALRTHQSGFNGSGNSKMVGGVSFFTLPPSNVMENLLGSSVRSLSPYYTLFHGVTLDPNELMLDNDTSTLLFLLMMAQGASSIPKTEARNLAAGLTETCRISLFDVIEKNVELSADPIVLKSALLFTILGAWGGDAWHINIAMGQRGMYLAELSLFHDIAPILSITELQTPLPESERLWRASNALEWLDIVHEYCAEPGNSGFHSPAHAQAGLSLSHLFQDMLRDELEIKNRRLSPLRLKLLLHPLQLLVCHLGQFLSCFSGMYDSKRSSRPLTTASTLLRIEEVQSSVQKWYDLCMINVKRVPNCATTNSSLVLWHLISLNVITYFPEIEKLVRDSAFDEPMQETVQRSQRLIYQPEKSIYHCGQVFKIVGAMPKSGRPPWWSAAIYRATMILLAESILRPLHQRETEENGPLVMINLVASEDPSINAYICNFYGTPALVNKDGSFTRLGSPDELLTCCITLLDDGTSTRFSDGIKRKLQKVLQTWNGKMRKGSFGSSI